MSADLNLKLSKQEEDYFINFFVHHINEKKLLKTEKIKNLNLPPYIPQNNPYKLEDNPKNPKKSNKPSHFKVILDRTKQKFHLGTQTNEPKFKAKMQPFLTLDSFIDIRSFLHDMNLTNNPDLDKVFSKIKQKLRKDIKGNYYVEQFKEDDKEVKEEEEEEETVSQLKKPLENSFDLNADLIKGFNKRIIQMKKGQKPLKEKRKKFLDVKIGDYLLELERPLHSLKEPDFNEILVEKIKNNDLFKENIEKEHLFQDQERI